MGMNGARDRAARLGFVGCGTIAAAMIEGLMAAGHTAPIVVSPRSAETAAALAAKFAEVTVAADNQAVLDGSDLVVLAVRPQILDTVLAELKFEARHRVLSLVATVTLDYLRSATAPATVVARAVPLPAVAWRQGPTAVYPADEEALALFDRLGRAVGLSDESEFSTFTAATAMMASHFAFAEAVSGWMANQGIADDKAQTFVAAMLRGLSATAEALPDRSFAALAAEHETRGGLNEQLHAFLRERGFFAAVAEGLDGIAKRVAVD
jgi:pyrroline-5-carboxylate reductase